ncbi:MAG: hypothetical protein OZ922_09595 [Myxococcales bacterium]|jgi:hypothetical protein|nr:hypothetical protein [Myxococcales bacterium]
MEPSASARVRFARDLRGLYLAVRRIASQLRSHATLVPYDRVERALHALADRADAQAATLAAELHALAGNPDPSDAEAPRLGRNHWECMTLDLADLEVLKRRYLDLALRWDVDFPASAATLTTLGHKVGSMSVIVRDMVARSDPHAVRRP